MPFPAATYALEARMTVNPLAATWALNPAVAEGVELAARSFRTHAAKLSCCYA